MVDGGFIGGSRSSWFCFDEFRNGDYQSGVGFDETDFCRAKSDDDLYFGSFDLLHTDAGDE